MDFTHLINPFAAPDGSEHSIAQRITFASLRHSVEAARESGISVEVLAAGFPEDNAVLEPPAVALPPLDRSILDIRPLKPPRQLPLLADLLNAAAEHGTGTYVIYTNIDIALQRDFYVRVAALIKTEGEAKQSFACVINRRTISKRFNDPAQLPEMYKEAGEPHPGYDCFVFPRAWIGKMELGNTCIGTRHFDGLLIANLDVLSRYRLKIYRELHWTFHIGDDKTWVSQVEYDEYNLSETIRALSKLAVLEPPPPGTHFHYLYSGYMRQSTMRSWLLRRVKRISILVKTAKYARQAMAGHKLKEDA